MPYVEGRALPEGRRWQEGPDGRGFRLAYTRGTQKNWHRRRSLGQRRVGDRSRRCVKEQGKIDFSQKGVAIVAGGGGGQPGVARRKGRDSKGYALCADPTGHSAKYCPKGDGNGKQRQREREVKQQRMGLGNGNRQCPGCELRRGSGGRSRRRGHWGNMASGAKRNAEERRKSRQMEITCGEDREENVHKQVGGIGGRRSRGRGSHACFG